MQAGWLPRCELVRLPATAPRRTWWSEEEPQGYDGAPEVWALAVGSLKLGIPITSVFFFLVAATEPRARPVVHWSVRQEPPSLFSQPRASTVACCEVLMFVVSRPIGSQVGRHEATYHWT